MTFNVLLILLTSLASTMCCVSVLLILRQNRRFAKLKNDTDKQLRMANSSLVGMGNRVLDLEKRLALLRKDQQVLSDTQQDFSYSKAKKLVEQGIQIEAIAASTGLSFSEIELIKLIQTQSTGAAGSYSKEH